MPRSVRFFRNICPHCNLVTGVPLLGDFSYAEFIYQTENGNSYSYVSAITNPAWERVKAIFKESTDINLAKNDDSIRIYQNVLICIADPYDENHYTTSFPLCSECGGKITEYNDSEILFDKQIQDASWDRFLALTKTDQTDEVLTQITKQ